MLHTQPALHASIYFAPLWVGGLEDALAALLQIERNLHLVILLNRYRLLLFFASFMPCHNLIAPRRHVLNSKPSIGIRAREEPVGRHVDHAPHLRVNVA